MLKEMSENWILYKSSAKYGVRKTETERIEDLETQSKEQQREKISKGQYQRQKTSEEEWEEVKQQKQAFVSVFRHISRFDPHLVPWWKSLISWHVI